MIKKIGFMLALLLVGSVSSVFGQTVSTSTTTSTSTKAQPAKMRAEAMREQFRTMREQFKVKKVEIEKKKSANRLEIQNRLKQVKSAKKKQIAESAYKQIQNINSRWTDHFENVLDKYADILGKVEVRRDKIKSSSIDVAVIEFALRKAYESIVKAKTAVEAQAVKTYVVASSTDSQVREAFRSVHKTLKSDLKGLRDGVMKDVRADVQAAIKSVQIPKKSVNSSSTNS